MDKEITLTTREIDLIVDGLNGLCAEQSQEQNRDHPLLGEVASKLAKAILTEDHKVQFTREARGFVFDNLYRAKARAINAIGHQFEELGKKLR